MPFLSVKGIASVSVQMCEACSCKFAFIFFGFLVSSCRPAKLATLSGSGTQCFNICTRLQGALLSRRLPGKVNDIEGLDTFNEDVVAVRDRAAHTPINVLGVYHSCTKC